MNDSEGHATGSDDGDDHGSHHARRPMRATDEERGRVADALSEALGRGQIDLTEFDERTNAAWGARTRDELADPLADLVPDPWSVIRGGPVAGPAAGAALPAHRRPSVPPVGMPSGEVGDIASRDLAAAAKAHVTGEKGGSGFTAAVMFGADQGGDWICPPTHYSVAVMGGVEVDLRRARFESADTEIVAVAIMGGVEIIVPEDVRLTIQGTGLMGGFGAAKSREVIVPGLDLPLDAPRIRVTGIALMGGVDIRREPRRGRPELN